jgi:hypothetical protein
VYEQTFEEGQDLFQYIRGSSAGDSGPGAGNWFCLAGATTKGVAIIDGGSGRTLHRYTVNATFTAIEGAARPQSTNWSWSGGGPGGATQIYVPPRLIGHLSAVASHARW